MFIPIQHGQNRMVYKKPTDTYGYLYNWYAIDSSGFAPTNWVVMDEAQWDTLAADIGGYSVGGGKLKEISTTHWLTPNTDAADTYDFTSLPGGLRNGDDGTFEWLTYYGWWWSSTLEYTDLARVFRMYYYNANLVKELAPLDGGAYVRLIYTGVGNPGNILIDFDGNGLDIITINGKYYTAQNWKCTTLQNGNSIPNVTNNATWSALTTLGRCAYDNNENNV